MSLAQDFADKVRVRVSVRPEIGDDNMTSLFGQPPQQDGKGKFYICHASCADRIRRLHNRIYTVSEEFIPGEEKKETEVVVTKEEVAKMEKKLTTKKKGK